MEPVMQEIIDLVVEDGETVDGVMTELAGDHAAYLEWTVVKEIGPGGGHPVVKVVGSKAMLDDFMVRYEDGIEITDNL